MISVAFDGRKYSDYGIGTYVRHLIDGFARHPSTPRLTLFTSPTNPGPSHVPSSWTRTEVPFRGYSLGELLLFGREIRASGCDLFHTPHYTTPARPGLPTVVTIHDLIHLRFPGIFSPLQRSYARLMVGHAVRSASIILSPSEATKRDLTAFVNADPAKIKVTPLGVDGLFRPQSEEAIALFRSKYSLPSRYVLFLGNPKPHKGIVTLIQAMAHIRKQDKDLHLVVAGGTEDDSKRVKREATVRGIGDLVISVRALTNDEIPLVIGGARLLAMPSMWEGFGLPVVEAMACGTPVVCSSAGSLPEVAGKAALFSDPEDLDLLAANILSVAEDDIIHRKHRELGIAQARSFSWESTVESTLEAYRSVLS